VTLFENGTLCRCLSHMLVSHTLLACSQESGWNVVNVAKVARELQKEYADAPYMDLPDLGTLTGDRKEITQL
jgi:hypothetical protein